MSDLVVYTKERAADLEHEWDRRAIDWPLTRESVVVEVGGYTGRWALQIAERYNPLIYVFEPQIWAFRVCDEVLAPYRVKVFPFGVGVRDEELPVAAYETDGCTFIAGDGPLCQLKEASHVLPGHIDLMMVNIEGYEYTLIPHMLDQGILPQRLMIQFHTFADTDGSKAAAIHERLTGLGYAIAWTYGTILTAWERTVKPMRGRPGRKKRVQ